jgi:hypothetical protein
MMAKFTGGLRPNHGEKIRVFSLYEKTDDKARALGQEPPYIQTVLDSFAGRDVDVALHIAPRLVETDEGETYAPAVVSIRVKPRLKP